MASSQRHKELADFLRSRRQGLTPQTAGLPKTSARRHVKGLRREEVAALSGVSLTWYTYLEQGRPIRVSEQVLDSLARTYRLTADERNYLFALASPLLRDEPERDRRETVSESLQHMLDELAVSPAFVIGSRWEVVAWNRMGDELFGDFSEMQRDRQSLIRRMFADKAYRAIFADWPYMAKRLLAFFRSYYGKHVDDPWYGETVEQLKRESPEFAEWWEKHEVFEAPSGQKEFRHPEAGRISLKFNSFAVGENPNLTLLVFTPVDGTGTREKLLALTDTVR